MDEKAKTVHMKGSIGRQMAAEAAAMKAMSALRVVKGKHKSKKFMKAMVAAMLPPPPLPQPGAPLLPPAESDEWKAFGRGQYGPP